MIKTLQNQVNYLQQKVNSLENQINHFKNVLNETLKAPRDTKINQQGYSNLTDKKGAYLTQNNSEVSGMESKSFSEVPRSPQKSYSSSTHYNIPLIRDKAQNENNFITLGKILKDEQTEIIQRGFQLQKEGKISLKKYYQSTDPDSLFQWKGYSIKYETIRGTKLYQQLK
jgi:flagellar biosynthesis chaperone FliJ